MFDLFNCILEFQMFNGMSQIRINKKHFKTTEALSKKSDFVILSMLYKTKIYFILTQCNKNLITKPLFQTN